MGMFTGFLELSHHVLEIAKLHVRDTKWNFSEYYIEDCTSIHSVVTPSYFEYLCQFEPVSDMHPCGPHKCLHST